MLRHIQGPAQCKASSLALWNNAAAGVPDRARGNPALYCESRHAIGTIALNPLVYMLSLNSSVFHLRPNYPSLFVSAIYFHTICALYGHLFRVYCLSVGVY